MAKRHGFEIGDYGLPASIRKRIDDLIELNLNPSTINLLTSEFSSIEDHTRENIGRYIANLLEIETAILERHFEKIKELNQFGNSKQDLILKQRKTNLLRIQQIFATKDTQFSRIKPDLKLSLEEGHSTSKLNFKNAMMTNTIELNQEQLAKENLKELANKKRLIELAIFEEENKIKVAQKQYQDAKKINDTSTQEIKLDLIDKSNKKLKKIDKAIKNYKSIAELPLEILLDDDQEIDFVRDEKKLRDFLTNKDKIAFDKMQNDLKILNETKKVDENIFDDFFSVEGYDDFNSFSNCSKEQENKIETLNKKTLPQKPQEEKKEILISKNINSQSLEDEFNKKIIVAKKSIREKEENRLKELLIKDKKSAIEKNKLLNEEQEVDSNGKEVSERIIKKIKKNSKAKDKKIEKIKQEKENAVKELNSLKEKQKVEQLRRIEISKRKAEEQTNAILKKEKQKVETSYNILERKLSAFRIKTTLFSKEKAINAIRLIKQRAAEIEAIKKDSNEDLIAYPHVDEVSLVTSEFKDEKKVINNSSNNIDEAPLLFEENIIEETNLIINFDEDTKRIDYLERKKKLNIISNDEIIELENKKNKLKNRQLNNKVNLKKFTLIKKNYT